MSEGNSFAQRWQNYQPSKATWFWSCFACIVLTMIIGFTWGGWVTGGSAESMAARAAQDAREQLVASICVERFVTAPNAAGKLEELKKASSWERDDFIEDGGWAKIVALDEAVPGAAEACADKLIAMDAIPAGADTTAAGPTAGNG